MSRLSKFIAIIMCFVLVSSVLSVVSSAASTINYSVSSASGSQGDTVTVYVNVSSSVGMTGGQVSLNFDSSKLQVVSCSAGGAFTTESVRNNGSSILCTGMTMGDSSAKKSGTFAIVKFKILASSGSVALTLTPSSISADHVGVGNAALTPTKSNGSITVTKPVTGITLDKSSVTLKKGETATITPTVTPADATNKSVTYSTSNSKVAKVSGGKITAVGGGTATITATAGGKSAKCTVYVKVAQTGIAVSGSKDKSVAEGSTLKLTTAKVPADATDNYSTTWTSSDNSIATVSSNGTVTGVKLGTVTITATSNGWKVTYNVTVTEKGTDESSTNDPEETELPTEIESETSEIIVISEPDQTASLTTPDKEKSNSSKTKKIYNKIFDKNKTVNKGYHYVMLAVVGLVTTAICVPVTAIVTSSIVKNKGKKKDPEGPEEK